MISSYISLGSNLADALSSPKEQLKLAIHSISSHPNILLNNVSSLYQSAPIGMQDQPQFINAVIKIETDLNALDLLNYLQEIENDHGRKRIPHPEMENRAFVLIPLLEISPDFQPLSGQPINALLEKCANQGIVKCNR